MYSELDSKIIYIISHSEKYLRDYADSIGENIFEEDYRLFAKYLSAYYKAYKTCPTLSVFVDFVLTKKNKNLYDYVTSTWEKIEEAATDEKEYPYLIEQLTKRYNLQIIHSIKNRLSTDEENLDDTNELLFRASHEVASLHAKKILREGTLKESADEWYDQFLAKKQNPEISKGIMTGFSVMDHWQNGLRKKESLVFCANTGGGKSVFLINTAVNMWMYQNKLPKTMKELDEIIEKKLWKPGNNGIIASLEMPKEEINDRILSCMCSIDSRVLANPGGSQKITKEEEDRALIALKFWKHYPYHIKVIEMNKGIALGAIQATFDDVCVEFRPDFWCLDYLQLLVDSDKTDIDWQKLIYVAEEFFEFNKVNNVAGLTGLQLTVTKPGEGGIGIHRIGRSKNIINSFNIALQVEQRENEHLRADSVVHCIKNRRGPLFVMNNLRKEFAYNRFADMGMPKDEGKSIGSIGEDLSSVAKAIFSPSTKAETKKE